MYNPFPLLYTIKAASEKANPSPDRLLFHYFFKYGYACIIEV